MPISLRDTKRSLTEQTIVAKALDLFKQQGFDNVSVRQIARAALVSQKTVFNYFPYKELIVVAAAQPRLHALMDGIQQQIDDLAEPTAVLRAFSEGVAELSMENQELTALVVAELLTLDPDRLAHTMRYVPDFAAPIRTVMVLARSQGRMRPELSVEYATEFLISSVLNVLRTYFASGHSERVRPMLGVTLEIFLHGAFLPGVIEERSNS